MKRRVGQAILALGAMFAIAAGAARPGAAADRPWVEVTSPHFAVVSDAGEKEGRRIAWQFEQVRALLQKLWPWAHADFDRPVLVFAVRNEQALKELAPAFWEKKGGSRPSSVFVSAADRHWVAL